MKYTFKTLIVVLMMGIMFQSGCVKEKFTKPDQTTPNANLSSNLTIGQFKSNFSGLVVPLLIGDTLVVGSDTVYNPVLQGIVNSTDESGNLYKTLYIQDNTGGIQIALDRTSLYTNLKIGQRVFIKLSGIYVGSYGGVVQLGYIYNGSIGRLPNILIDKYVFKDSLPGASPIPLERNGVAVSGNDMNMLVKLKNVHFAEVGQVYAEKEITTNRTILDSTGTQSIILRTSGYCNFRANLLPKGQGDLVGILSAYNGVNQFYIRDLDDLVNWDSTISFPIDIINETFATSLGSFTQYSVLGNEIWTPSSYGAKMSGYNGSYFANEDWLISPSINFDNYTLEKLSFISSMNYGVAGDGSLKLYTSTDYSGTGDPYLATWTEVTPLTLSGGGWANVSSGNIDLSGINGTNVHFAFKYTCSTSNVATWEITTLKLNVKPN